MQNMTFSTPPPALSQICQRKKNVAFGLSQILLPPIPLKHDVIFERTLIFGRLDLLISKKIMNIRTKIFKPPKKFLATSWKGSKRYRLLCPWAVHTILLNQLKFITVFKCPVSLSTTTKPYPNLDYSYLFINSQ